jgi:large conductance mechanosensitive channel
MGGFKKFLLRGNLIDLAVAVVIGIAFNAVVQALIKDIVTPLIAAIGGKPNFGALSFTVNKSIFEYGSFINALLSFVIIAAVIYYLVVMPTNRVTSLATRHKDATERQCPECLSMIPVGARKHPGPEPRRPERPSLAPAPAHGLTSLRVGAGLTSLRVGVAGDHSGRHRESHGRVTEHEPPGLLRRLPDRGHHG